MRGFGDMPVSFALEALRKVYGRKEDQMRATIHKGRVTDHRWFEADGMEWAAVMVRRMPHAERTPVQLRRIAGALEDDLPGAPFPAGAARGLRVIAAAIEDGEAPWG